MDPIYHYPIISLSVFDRTGSLPLIASVFHLLSQQAESSLFLVVAAMKGVCKIRHIMWLKQLLLRWKHVSLQLWTD